VRLLGAANVLRSPEREVEAIIGRVEGGRRSVNPPSAGHSGETVQVIDGPFANFGGRWRARRRGRRLRVAVSSSAARRRWIWNTARSRKARLRISPLPSGGRWSHQRPGEGRPRPPLSIPGRPTRLLLHVPSPPGGSYITHWPALTTTRAPPHAPGEDKLGAMCPCGSPAPVLRGLIHRRPMAKKILGYIQASGAAGSPSPIGPHWVNAA
jgi:hypothetical protein